MAGDPILLLGGFLLGCIAGWLLGISYLRWADSREQSRFGDYVYKRYEDGKVTHVVPMTAEQRAAADKAFVDANADSVITDGIVTGWYPRDRAYRSRYDAETNRYVFEDVTDEMFTRTP